MFKDKDKSKDRKHQSTVVSRLICWCTFAKHSSLSILFQSKPPKQTDKKKNGALIDGNSLCPRLHQSLMWHFKRQFLLNSVADLCTLLGGDTILKSGSRTNDAAILSDGLTLAQLSMPVILLNWPIPAIAECVRNARLCCCLNLSVNPSTSLLWRVTAWYQWSVPRTRDGRFMVDYLRFALMSR